MKRLGIDLLPQDQKLVLSQYVYRYTRDHIPQYINDSPLGHYKPQFDSDLDWLKHTFFRVKLNGRLDQRARFCESHPTWPDGTLPKWELKTERERE